MNYDLLKKGLENLYDEGSKCQIYFEGKKIEGIMYGNNECFSCNDFYQLLLTKEKLLICFYDIEDEKGNEIDLEDIDYDNPAYIEQVEDTESYEQYA